MHFIEVLCAMVLASFFAMEAAQGYNRALKAQNNASRKFELYEKSIATQLNLGSCSSYEQHGVRYLECSLEVGLPTRLEIIYVLN